MTRDEAIAAGRIPGPDDPRRCQAQLSDKTRPCTRWAIRGATVCPKHGASAPQVKRAAQLRILEAADSVAAELLRLALDRKTPPAVKVAAARDLLDRAGLAATQLVQVAHEMPDPAERLARIAELRDELAERRAARGA